MPYARKSLWVLIFMFAALATGHCGRKSDSRKGGTTPAVNPYIPEAWDGEEDWSGNAFEVEDITP